MVSSKGPHSEHVPELREPIKYLVNVVLLEAEQLVGLALGWDQVVLVDRPKDETNVSKVRAFLEHD